MRITFDHGPGSGREKFESPREVITARDPEDVPEALRAMDAARSAGLWLAGYASYELGYALDPKLSPLMPEARKMPLLSFGALCNHLNIRIKACSLGCFE